MSLKDSVKARLSGLLQGATPAISRTVKQQLVEVRARLDRFNKSLADRALPENRKKMVGRLALTQKARAAGQHRRTRKAAKTASAKTTEKGEV